MSATYLDFYHKLNVFTEDRPKIRLLRRHISAHQKAAFSGKLFRAVATDCPSQFAYVTRQAVKRGYFENAAQIIEFVSVTNSFDLEFEEPWSCFEQLSYLCHDLKKSHFDHLKNVEVTAILFFAAHNSDLLFLTGLSSATGSSNRLHSGTVAQADIDAACYRVLSAVEKL